MNTAPEPEDYRVQRLREALAKDPRVGELELEVRSAGGKVFVSGLVGTEERRSAIDAVAREVVPDLRVVNETAVSSFPAPPPAPEHLTT
jgi:hypothetical protein